MPVYCGEEKKRSDGARKKKRRSTVVSAPQKIKPPLPYPINDREGFLLSTSSANERTVPGNTAVELHRLWCLCWFQCVRTMLICVSVSSAWSEYASAAPWVKETLVWGYLLLGQTGETGSYQYRWVLRCLLRVGRTKVQIVKIFFFSFFPSQAYLSLFSASTPCVGGGTSLFKVSSVSSFLCPRQHHPLPRLCCVPGCHRGT